MNIVLKVSILQKFTNQADFAQATGIDETVLSRIVKGRRTATSEQKKTISKALNIPVDELFPTTKPETRDAA
jgi:transcriptional regulator with XRE-family HTH domain